MVSPHQLKHTILRGSRAARYLFESLAHSKPCLRSIEHGGGRLGRSEYHVFENISSLQLLATEINSVPRRSRAKLCALIDVETPQ